MRQLADWFCLLGLVSLAPEATAHTNRPGEAGTPLTDTWIHDTSSGGEPDRRCYGRPNDLKCEDYYQQISIGGAPGGTHGVGQLGCTWTTLANTQDPQSHCLRPWPTAHVPKTSSVVVGLKNTVPSPERWTRCQYCGLEGTIPETGPGPVLQAVLYDPTGSASWRPYVGEGTVLAQSKWESFFLLDPQHTNPGSYIHARVLDEPFSPQQCARYVERPTFVFHLLTWQVGHLLVDVLEPLFGMMRQELGTDFSSALLVFDVAGADQRTWLHDNLVHWVYEADTPFQLLRRFTASPIHLMSSIAKLPGVTCFHSLHVGLDVSNTDYPLGYDHHPHWLDLATLGGQALRRQYQLFQQFITSGLGPDSPAPVSPASAPVWTIIRRSGQRRLQNQDEVSDALAEAFPTVRLYEVTLEEMAFAEQVAQLRKSTVLIGQYGTGLHNVWLMRPGSSLVLVMPPLWCPWTWQMANQAVASGVHVVVLCQEAAPPPTARRWHRVRWSKQGWMQGPWHTKYTQQTVDVGAVIRLAAMARDLAASNQTAGVHHAEISYSHYPVLSDAVPDDDPVRVWAHFGNVSLEIFEGAPVLRLVPEVLVNQDPSEVFSQHSLLFCIEDNSGAQCLDAADLTEFGTLFANLAEGDQQGDESLKQYVLRAWVIERTSGQVIDGSETLLAVFIRDGQYAHISPEAFPQRPKGHNPRTIEVPVWLNGSVRTRLVINLEDDLSIQWQPALFSRKHGLWLAAKKQIANAVQGLAQAELLSARLGLPGVQHMPSPDRPFVFLHLEESGQSGFRKLIAEGALNNNLSHFVLGFTDSGDDLSSGQSWSSILPWDPQEAKPGLEVVVPSLSTGWDAWPDLPRAVAAEGQPRHCFVLLQDPLERVIAVYYQKIWNPHTPRRLNELSVEELEQLITDAPDSPNLEKFAHFPDQGSTFPDGGMSDAACRLLCSASMHRGQSVVNDRGFFKAYSYKLAQQQMSECVVGLLDKQNNTKDVLTRWFPWVSSDEAVQPGSSWWTNDKETPTTLESHVRRILLKHNQCDSQLYAHANRIFQQQLMVLNLSARQPTR